MLAARDGLTKVADDLVRRGETALDQGRFDDARATVERIRAVLPEHAGAKDLAQKIWPESAPVGASARSVLPLPEPDMRVARVETAPAPTPPPKPKVDPLVEANKDFEEALAEGRLLTPAEQSAKHFVSVMNGIDVDHDLAKSARTALSLEFLSRAAQSIEALDPEAAGIWIDEAQALLGATDEGVRKARSALTEQLIAMESAKPVPASALKISDLRRASLSAASQRAQHRRLGRRRIHRRHGRQDAQRRSDRRVARGLVPPRSDGGRQQVAVRAPHVHGPGDRAELVHAHSLRPVTRGPRGRRGLP